MKSRTKIIFESIVQSYGLIPLLISIAIFGFIFPFAICGLGKAGEFLSFIIFGYKKNFAMACEMKNFVLSLNPLLIIPLSLVIGSFFFGFLVILIDSISPRFFESKILDSLYQRYVLAKLQGNIELAKKIHRKISEVYFYIATSKVK